MFVLYLWVVLGEIKHSASVKHESVVVIKSLGLSPLHAWVSTLVRVVAPMKVISPRGVAYSTHVVLQTHSKIWQDSVLCLSSFTVARSTGQTPTVRGILGLKLKHLCGTLCDSPV